MHRVSANPRKSCSTCNESAGAFSCDGCQQPFCLKHVAEHYQELTIQMDNLEHEHDLFSENHKIEQVAHESHIPFNKISVKLRQVREFDDFFENNLARWTLQLCQLRAEIRCMTNSITDNSVRSPIDFV